MGVPLFTQLQTEETEQPVAHRDAWTLSHADMQGARCVPKGGDHAGALLANLNLQRNRAQFCDCVVRQGQTSNLLYPAHRGVLAASSPVLASILSSAGALVELQAPGLSDSVLAHVLDYIYTGALPCPQSHQQYYNLFTAACYLKMDELQKTLETRVSADSRSGASLESVCDDAHRGPTPTSCSASDRRLQGMNSGSRGQITVLLPKAVPVTAGMCGVSRMGTEVQHYQVHSACPANPESWLQSTEMQTSAGENTRSSAKGGETSGAEATQRPCLTATSEPEQAQSHRREEQICYSPRCEDSGSGIASPSLPGPPCGAVPVIRHSSAAAAADVCTVSPYHPVSKVSGGNDGMFEEMSAQRGGTRSFDYSAGPDSPPKSSSAEEQTHSHVRAVLPLPLHEPDAGHVSEGEGVCNAEERKEPAAHLSRCLTEPGKPPSSLHRAEDTQESAFVRQEHEDTANNNQDRHKSQTRATSTLQVDTCEPSSYHAHLHYRCVHREDSLLSHRPSDQNRSPPDLSDRASDEDEAALFSGAAQHFSSADQVLLLDISTKPPELLISYRYDEQGDWAALGRDTFVTRRAAEAAETAADDSDGGLVHRNADVKSTDEPAGDQVKDQDADGENYAIRSSCVPDSPQAPPSPTSSFCLPPTISADVPTIISPQLSNRHPFQCSMCRRSFSQRGSLNRHMRSHLGIRPFPCPRCPMTFSRQYRVSEHMRVHQRCVLRNDLQKPPASLR